VPVDLKPDYNETGMSAAGGYWLQLPAKTRYVAVRLTSPADRQDFRLVCDTHTVNPFGVGGLKPNTHRRRRHDSTVELSRVGGVNAPVGSRDPVYNFLCC